MFTWISEQYSTTDIVILVTTILCQLMVTQVFSVSTALPDYPVEAN